MDIPNTLTADHVLNPVNISILRTGKPCFTEEDAESPPKLLRDHYKTLYKTNSILVIIDNLKTILVRMEAHRLSYMHYRSCRRCFEFPRVIISAFLSSALSVALFSGDTPVTQAATFSMATINFFLTITLDYFGYHRKEKEHDLSYKLYTTLFRSIQLKILSTSLTDEAKTNLLHDLLSQLSILEQYEDVVPRRFEVKAQQDPNVYEKLRLGDMEETI